MLFLCILVITYVCLQTETRKAELETNLSTNLKRRKQEFEAIISSSETDLHENEAESKWQELKDAESLVIDATQRLEGGNFGLMGLLLFGALELFMLLTETKIVRN